MAEDASVPPRRRRRVTRPRTHPTVVEVAREAGVSTASVSRVLNDVPPISPELALAVQAAAERLGFRINEIARALRVKRTQTVGLVVPNLANPFFPKLVQELEVQLRSQGHGLLLADSLDDVGLESERVEELLDRQVDGLIVSPCNIELSRAAVEQAATRAPVVQLDRKASSRIAFVGMDHEDAMRSVLSHLRGAGRSGFAYVGSRLDNYPAVRRHLAYLNQVGDGASAQRVLLDDFSYEWGVEAAGRTLDQWPEVEAIVCGNDLVALGVISRLIGLGVEVPDRIAVTGFDDTMLAQYSRPAVTTVRQPLASMAAATLALLTEHRDGGGDDDGGDVVELPGDLIVRDSTPSAGGGPEPPSRGP